MKPPWLTWFAGVLGLVVSCCSCADKVGVEARVLERVTYVKQLTLPLDATALWRADSSFRCRENLIFSRPFDDPR
jgi:hypothetical protein